jgi:hypothetical protein
VVDAAIATPAINSPTIKIVNTDRLLFLFIDIHPFVFILIRVLITPKLFEINCIFQTSKAGFSTTFGGSSNIEKINPLKKRSCMNRFPAPMQILPYFKKFQLAHQSPSLFDWRHPLGYGTPAVP